jgi:hypothetical protein
MRDFFGGAHEKFFRGIEDDDLPFAHYIFSLGLRFAPPRERLRRGAARPLRVSPEGSRIKFTEKTTRCASRKDVAQRE